MGNPPSVLQVAMLISLPRAPAVTLPPRAGSHPDGQSSLLSLSSPVIIWSQDPKASGWLLGSSLISCTAVPVFQKSPEVLFGRRDVQKSTSLPRQLNPEPVPCPPLLPFALTLKLINDRRLECGVFSKPLPPGIAYCINHRPGNKLALTSRICKLCRFFHSRCYSNKSGVSQGTLNSFNCLMRGKKWKFYNLMVVTMAELWHNMVSTFLTILQFKPSWPKLQNIPLAIF